MILRLRDVGIHPARIILKEMPVRRIHGSQRGVCGMTNFKNALDAIVLDRPGPQNLRKIACSETAQHIQLPQPILRGHVPLRNHKIVHVRGHDVRYAVHIPPNRHRLRQTRYM